MDGLDILAVPAEGVSQPRLTDQLQKRGEVSCK